MKMTVNKQQLQAAIELVLEPDFFQEWELHDQVYEFKECNSCGWNSIKEGRLGHYDGCELRSALDLIETFLEK